MPDFQLFPLDVNNEFHLKLTYSIHKERYRFKNININNSICPTYQTHVDYLKTKPYYCFYVVSFGNIFFAMQYVTYNNVYAAYCKTSRLKRISKKYYSYLNNRSSIFCQRPFQMMLDLHPELVNLKAEVNIKNRISLSSAKNIGFKELYTVLSFNKNEK